MKVVADLHLHSKYSRAVSQQMVLPEMAKWAKRKGINLVGTGDFTHPMWLRELTSLLDEAGEGIYKYKDSTMFLKTLQSLFKSTRIGSIVNVFTRELRII